MKSNLHEPAMEKVSGIKIEPLVKAFGALAETAAESNAATADFKLSWLSESEIVDARYVPELILRVVEP